MKSFIFFVSFCILSTMAQAVDDKEKQELEKQELERLQENFPLICANEIQNQFQHELDASLTYLILSAQFSAYDKFRPGLSKFLLDSANEERDHAKKLIEYFLMRGRNLAKEKTLDITISSHTTDMLTKEANALLDLTSSLVDFVKIYKEDYSNLELTNKANEAKAILNTKSSNFVEKIKSAIEALRKERSNIYDSLTLLMLTKEKRMNSKTHLELNSETYLELIDKAAVFVKSQLSNNNNELHTNEITLFENISKDINKIWENTVFNQTTKESETKTKLKEPMFDLFKLIKKPLEPKTPSYYESIKSAYQLEEYVTSKIKKLVKTCNDEHDDHANDYLIGEFLQEQHESLRQLSGYIKTLDKLKKGEDMSTLNEIIFDNKLLSGT